MAHNTHIRNEIEPSGNEREIGLRSGEPPLRSARSTLREQPQRVQIDIRQKRGMSVGKIALWTLGGVAVAAYLGLPALLKFMRGAENHTQKTVADWFSRQNRSLRPLGSGFGGSPADTGRGMGGGFSPGGV